MKNENEIVRIAKLFNLKNVKANSIYARKPAIQIKTNID